jgi:hypothetical protein
LIFKKKTFLFFFFEGTYLPITGVLRTKWATIELRWDDDSKPSLN